MKKFICPDQKPLTLQGLRPAAMAPSCDSPVLPGLGFQAIERGITCAPPPPSGCGADARGDMDDYSKEKFRGWIADIPLKNGGY